MAICTSSDVRRGGAEVRLEETLLINRIAFTE